MAAETFGHVLTAAAGFTVATGVAKLCWNGDEAVSEAYRDLVRQRIQGASASYGNRGPGMFLAALDQFLGRDAFRLRFIGRAVLIAVVLALALFIPYVAATPGLFDSLINDEYQRTAVARHVSVQVFLVSALATWLSLAYSGSVAEQMDRDPRARVILHGLAKDLAMKTLVIMAALAVIYVGFALAGFGFLGNPLLALRSVPVTFWSGLRFHDLSAVYIYSAYASSLWLWAYAVAWLVAPVLRFTSGALRWDQYPIRSLGLLAAALILLVYYVGYVVLLLVH